MREIKFKAWDIAKSVMHYEFEILALTGRTFFDEKPTQYWKLMQYTGQKDKNEKEGYHKDRVKGKTNKDFEPKTSISFEGTIEWDDSTDACWYIATTNDSMPYLKFYHVEEWEITGNEYEKQTC